MGRALDLSGKRFGKLTVTSEYKSDKQGRHWKCTCDCGNTTWVRANLLRNGNTKSCGCLIKDTNALRFEDLRGQTFGRLKVLDQEPRSSGTGKEWLCRCDCGTEKWVLASSLKNGNTQSCGCLQKERVYESNFKDLRGRTFGRLTVLDQEPEKRERKGGYSPRTYWHCKCECGKELWVNASNLLSGHTKSCGCYYEEDFVDGTRVTSVLQKLLPTNTAGYKNVSYDHTRQKYAAIVQFKKVRYFLGYYDNPKESFEVASRFREEVIAPFLEDKTFGINKREDGYEATYCNKSIGIFKTLEEANEARFKEAAKYAVKNTDDFTKQK